MFASLSRLLLISAVLVLSQNAIQAQIQVANITRNTPVSFEKEILPIFQRNCLACHSESERNGDLVLETPQAILKGGDTGPGAVAGQGAASLLITLASNAEEPFMPPPDNDVAAKPLTPAELGLIKLWIDQGAKGNLPGGVLSPKKWRPLPPGNHPVFAAAISPDGQFAACGRANQIFVYHAPTGKLIARLNDPALQTENDARPGAAHLDVVQSLAFNPAGDMLASGGYRTLKLWRFPRDVQRQTLPAQAAELTAVAVSSDGALAAIGSSDNTIKLWDLLSGEIKAQLLGHAAPVTSLCFSHDSTTLYSTGKDQALLSWGTTDGKLLARIDTPSSLNALTTVQFPSPEELAAKEAAAAEAAAGAQPEGDAVQTPAAETAPAAESTTEEPSGEQSPEPTFAPLEQIVTGGDDNVLRVWEPPTAPIDLPHLLAGSTVMAVSADHQWLALADAKGTVQISTLGAEAPLRSWQAHEGPINAMAFHFQPSVVSEEGEETAPAIHRVATAGAAGLIKVWDINNPEAAPQVLRGSLTTVERIAFAPAGDKLSAGDDAGNITVWSLAPIEPEELQAAPSPAGVKPTVSPDGKLLAYATTASGRPAIVVRDAATGQILHTLLGHGDTITSLAFSADNTKLVSGSVDKSARVWNLADVKFPEAAAFTGHEAAVTAVAFNANATQVCSGAANNTLKLWTIADPVEPVDFAGHTGAIVAVFVTPQNQPISVSADKTARIWNAANGQAVRTITAPVAAVGASMTSDGLRLAIAGADTNIYLHQTDNGALLHTLAGRQAAIAQLNFSADGARLVSLNAEQALVWNVADGRFLEGFAAEEAFTGAAFSAEPQQLFFLSAPGRVVRRSMQFSAALPPLPAGVTAMVYHPAGPTLFAASSDGAIRSFNTDTAAQIFAVTHGAPVHDLAIRGDGAMLASAGEDKLVKIFNPQNGAALAPTQLTGVSGPAQHVSFTSDDQQIVAAGGTEAIAFALDGVLEERFPSLPAEVVSLAALGDTPRQVAVLYEGGGKLLRLSLVRRIIGHTQPVTSLAAVSGVQVVSGSADGTLRHWNVQAATPMVRQFNQGGVVLSVASSSDGVRFASTGSDKTARLWNAANGQQIAVLQGDLRADTLVAKLTEQKTASTAKVAAAKAASAAAVTDLPVKQAAEKTRADALTAAETDVTTKTAAVAAAAKAKADAEQKAIVSAAAAQLAAQKQEVIDLAALAAATEATKLAQTATSALAIAQSEPGNEALAKAATAAQAAATAADAKAKTAAAAKPAALAAFQTAATAANAAATAAVATNKPFTDATAALATSTIARDQAKQLHAAAQRDLEMSQKAVPDTQAGFTAAEAALKKADADLIAATEAAAAAKQPIRTIAFAPDNRTLATGGDFTAVHTWDAETGKPLGAFVGHTGPVQSLAFTPGEGLLSAGADKTAVVWDMNPNWQLDRVIGAIDRPEIFVDRVAAVAFSRDGDLVAAGGGVPSRTGEVAIYNAESGELVQAIRDAHTDTVNAVVFSPDSQAIATAGADKYVKSFSVGKGELIRQFEGHTNHVLGVAWRANGAILASSGADGVLRLWNAQTSDRIRDVAGYTKQVTAVRFIGQTQFTLSCSGDNIVRMHNSDNGGAVRNFAGATDYMYTVDATPNSQIVIAGGHDGVLRIWNGANAQVMHTIGPPETTEESAVAAK